MPGAPIRKMVGMSHMTDAIRCFLEKVDSFNHREWCITIEEEVETIFDITYQSAKENNPKVYEEEFKTKACNISPLQETSIS